MSCGGCTDARDLTADEKTMVTGLKEAIEAKAGGKFETFEPVSVRTQVVAGTNYFVKINVGGDKAVHARVYKPLGADAPSVSGAKSVGIADALEYFDAN